MEEAIKAYLEQFAAQDLAFALIYPHPTKTIEGCCRYIMKHYEDIARNKRARQVALCASDEEVYGLAVHYFEEDSIEEVKDKKQETPKAPANTKPLNAKNSEKPSNKGTNKANVVQLELF